MSDPWRQAATFRERAAECVRLSEMDLSSEIQLGYRRLAEAYLTMANNELITQNPAVTIPSARAIEFTRSADWVLLPCRRRADKAVNKTESDVVDGASSRHRSAIE